MPTFHDFTMKNIDGNEQKLADFKGKALLLVNVASRCGLTPQYDGLQKLHDELSGRGFAVLGFPCNQFAAQEPGSAAQIKDFCTAKYGVKFPLFAKIDVNGEQRAPLFAWLTGEKTEPDGPGDVIWNFGKFVIGRDGRVLARFNPRVAPNDPALRSAIEKALD